MNNKVIEFYEALGFTGKRMYNYLNKQIKYVTQEEDRTFVGCYPVIENDILKQIHLILPNGDDWESVVMHVHELAHFFSLYPYLNKEVFIDEGCEIFPIAMERLFIENSKDDKIIDWFNRYQYDLIKIALENEKIENVVGFLNHWDYIELYKETSSIPTLLHFKTHYFINPYEELDKKAKIMLKKI